MKINIDGVIRSETWKISVGVVIRNSDGQLMAALAKPFLQHSTPLAVELIAIKEAYFIFCWSWFFGGDTVTDSQETVRLLSSSGDNMDLNCFIVKDIKALLSVHVQFVSYACRDSNLVAHYVAKYTVGLCAFDSWIEEGPPWLNSAILSDVFYSLCV